MSFLRNIFGSSEDKETPDSEPSPAPPPPKPEPQPLTINELSPQELKARLDNGDNLVVVDMRQAWEYQAGHIPGAKHMFIQEIPARYSELPQETPIVFQCWHGNTSRDAAAFLIQNGWDGSRVYSLSGGIAGWSSAFGPEGLVRD